MLFAIRNIDSFGKINIGIMNLFADIVESGFQEKWALNLTTNYRNYCKLHAYPQVVSLRLADQQVRILLKRKWFLTH